MIRVGAGPRWEEELRTESYWRSSEDSADEFCGVGPAKTASFAFFVLAWLVATSLLRMECSLKMFDGDVVGFVLIAIIIYPHKYTFLVRSY